MTLQPKIEDVYRLLQESVIYYKSNPLKCLQPQSYATLAKKADLSTENLAKTICDKNRPYFFSRLWHNLKYNPSKIKFEWPLLATFESNVPVEGVFTGSQTNSYNLQIMVVDQYLESTSQVKCEGCGGRTTNDIFKDTEEILFNCLSYLSEVSYVVVDGKGRFYNNDHLTYLVANDLIDNKIDYKSYGNSFSQAIARDNKSVNAYRIDNYGASKLYGTIITVKIPIKVCYTPEFDFTPASKGEIPDTCC